MERDRLECVIGRIKYETGSLEDMREAGMGQLRLKDRQCGHIKIWKLRSAST